MLPALGNPALPTEELVVRLLVGAGMRRAEVCGLAVRGPDGLPDLMTDSLQRGRVELRVRGDAGAKGCRSRRVPITPRLAAAVKRYEARHRPETDAPGLAGRAPGGAQASFRFGDLDSHLTVANLDRRPELIHKVRPFWR